ncbi:hypothetical protein K9L67_04510 [Candidatus Woesearchaeota archaeon]|nr:hypothetical protein [Candidatus Woesearchaeota archaeon]MCF7901462.1 hypothetical protein [Candidatus Woesearchaeota archaeon]MCF8013547.1 hypothetical protein [Candidatus Woesearchaeota archaeon]
MPFKFSEKHQEEFNSYFKNKKPNFIMYDLEMFVLNAFLKENARKTPYEFRLDAAKKYVELTRELIQKEKNERMKEIYSEMNKDLIPILNQPIIINVNNKKLMYVGPENSNYNIKQTQITDRKVNLFEKNIYKTTQKKKNIFYLINGNNELEYMEKKLFLIYFQKELSEIGINVYQK